MAYSGCSDWNGIELTTLLEIVILKHDFKSSYEITITNRNLKAAEKSGSSTTISRSSKLKFTRDISWAMIELTCGYCGELYIY